MSTEGVDDQKKPQSCQRSFVTYPLVGCINLFVLSIVYVSHFFIVHISGSALWPWRIANFKLRDHMYSIILL